jgi:hypothetical protein
MDDQGDEKGHGSEHNWGRALRRKGTRQSQETPIDHGTDKMGREVNKKKINVTLSLDDALVQELRKESKQLNQSLNVRINAILQKHVKFYRMAELDGAAVIHPTLLQYFVQEIDESKFTAHWKDIGLKFIEGYFAENKIPFTFDNFVKYFLEELAIYAGIFKKVSRYVDEQDGKQCLFLVHGNDSKFSRIMGTVFSYQIEKLLNVHTKLRIFPSAVEIKIVG